MHPSTQKQVFYLCMSLSLVACAHKDQKSVSGDSAQKSEEARVLRPPSAQPAEQRSAPDAHVTNAPRAQEAAQAPTPGAKSGSKSGKWVLGYYVPYLRDLYAPNEIDWSGLTHIIFTRLKTTGGGQLVLDFDVDAAHGPEMARDMAERAHRHGKKALLMLGGMGAGASIADSASDQHRATFVKNLLRAVKDFGYDGLDLNWEDSVDWQRLIALARELRASPDSPADLILTYPTFPINANIGGGEPKLAELAKYLDQVSIMSYYPATAMAGGGWLSWHNSALTGAKPTTPVTIEDTLQRYAAAGIPRHKLSMGVGFYAICYTGGVTAPNQSTENGVSVQGGDNDFPLSRLFASGGPYDAKYRRWDSAAQVPYLTLPSPEAHGCRYVSYEDEQSLEAKGAFAKANGYGGIIIWTLNEGWLRNGKKASNALMQALKRGFID